MIFAWIAGGRWAVIASLVNEEHIGGARFPDTQWSQLLANRGDPQARRQALDVLVRTYWSPLYHYVRRTGRDAQAAEDVVQGLLATLIEGDALARLDPSKGRLRSYLLRATQNYLRKQHRKQTAMKRDVGKVTELAGAEAAEHMLSHAPPDPEAAYNQQWTATILDNALQRLKSEYEDGTRTGPFELVAQFFSGAEFPPYRQLAATHDMSVPQLKSFLHRARQRFRELVRDQVEQTVASVDETESELEQVLGFRPKRLR